MSNHSAYMRLDFAISMMEDGDLDAAIEAAEAAVELLPHDPQFHFVLADMYEKASRTEEAIKSFRQSLTLQDEDRLGAQVRLSLLGDLPAPERLPATYVEALFDDYAPRFERNLVKHLGYCAPQKLFDLLFGHLHRLPNRPDILDLGCGTGLAGDLLRPIAGYLEGIDLSEKMLRQAEKKHIYDHLVQGDIETSYTTNPKRFDLIVACDVFNYLGDLSSLLQRLPQQLNPRGILAFSVESPQEDTSTAYSLHKGQRYVHNREAVLFWLQGSGFEVIDEQATPIRSEKNQPVQGHLILARLKRQTKENTLEAANQPQDQATTICA